MQKLEDREFGRLPQDFQKIGTLLRRICPDSCNLTEEDLALAVTEIGLETRKQTMRWWEALVLFAVGIPGIAVGAFVLPAVSGNANENQTSVVGNLVLVILAASSVCVFLTMGARIRARRSRNFAECAFHAMRSRGVHCDQNRLRVSAASLDSQNPKLLPIMVTQCFVLTTFFILYSQKEIEETWLDLYVESFLLVIFSTALLSGIAFVLGLCLWPLSNKLGGKLIESMAKLNLVLLDNLQIFVIIGVIYLLLTGQ